MRIALGIEYNGHDFFGWQVQRDVVTIQGSLQDALSKVANEPIYLFCAGRTDANVHAKGQVVHFDTKAKRHVDAWIWGTNSYLPSAIVVKWARQVDYSFHARFSALTRRYRYIIFNHPVRPAILSHQVVWHYYPLDILRMQQAAAYLIGEQNFTSFRSSQCSAKSPMRNIIEFTIQRHHDFVVFEIEANAFLHHMVRNIAGVLMKIGAGFKNPEWMQEVLFAKNRRAAAETAPPEGLYLSLVRYPNPYIFPLPDPLFLI
ncbi:MAG: tRNA pseudouridine(38-40) synthase TruA [Gammaproteobacteria bacterium RIFCSPHIGHO2_12_FULL_37_14]|nr:MAG: tRNA pseudouridine(38-40) synthase TruA [Gammaproteobacteria bacterium RIFCSPHIGHO2_12_FULL_37_14]